MMETCLLVNINRIEVALDIAEPNLPVEVICHFWRSIGVVLTGTLLFRFLQQPVAIQQQKRPADSKCQADKVKSGYRSQPE